jgi:hypothetical protein
VLKGYDFSKAKKAKDIYPIVDQFNDAFLAGEFKIVDEYLKNLELDKLSELAKVAMVRFSYCAWARGELKEWIAARDRIAATLDNPSVLKGLY